MSMNIGSKIVSQLGSPNSKIPLAAKDIFNSAGYTYFSYDAGGSVEAKDRLVDEVGTGILWLFGIPAYKKLIDKTLFKKAGISPEVDVRVVKDNDYLQKALDNAPTKEIYNQIKKAGSNLSKTKSLNILKFLLSVGLTMVSFAGLTKLKQNMTKKNIEKEFLKNQVNKENKQQITPYDKQNPVFADITKQKSAKTVSFGSAAFVKTAEEFMLNPIKNMIVLDTCISGERLSHARTKGEFAEYGIKEGSFLFFVYGADKLIKKGIEKVSQKFLNTPINLDANFLSSEFAEKVLTNKSLQQEVKDFGKTFAQNQDSAMMYDFIFNNQSNIVVEAAKKSGIISTVKDSAGKTKIDTRKYINPDKMKELAENLQTFIDSGAKGKDIKSYLNKVKALKVGSTALNIGICCLFLGYIVPKMMYEYRQKHQDGNNDFHVKTEYEKELAKKYNNTL